MFEAFSAKMRETRAYWGDAHEPSAPEKMVTNAEGRSSDHRQISG
jgi:hypothetical protein